MVLLRYRAFEAQEQVMGRISDGVQGGQRVGLARRAARTCSLRPGGQREQLAQPTDVIAAQAGQLDHLDNIGPASGVVDEEAVELGGRRGTPSLEQTSLTNSVKAGKDESRDEPFTLPMGQVVSL